MCVIIVRQKNTPRVEQYALKNACNGNPHGLGVVWLDTFEVEKYKSTDYMVLDTDRPFIAHFRWASVGKVSHENIHPFRCGKNSNEWLMMNGTIWGLGTHDVTDTKILADSLGQIPREKWRDELSKYQCRFVSINTFNGTFQIYNHSLWSQHEGVWYSKDHILQKHFIAVYGTLRKSQSNYFRYLSNATYVGKGCTNDKYPLIVKGLPYLLDDKGKGKRVAVDIFRISDSMLADIDRLEGHPTFYIRKQIKIRHGKDVITCWVYFHKNGMTYNAKDCIKSYNIHMKESKPTYQTSYPHTPSRDIYPRTSAAFGTMKPAPYKAPANPFLQAEKEVNRYYRDQQMREVFKDDPDDDILDDGAVCPDCYHDAVHDGFSMYHCKACGGWFAEDDVIGLR
jgi:gamma-glutamylaminecyclotransferase